jgi:hypothetical protein
MQKVIKIKDQVNEYFLSVTLNDLLDNITPFVKDYKWAIYELDASVKDGGFPNYLELINKIDQVETGYCISWCELKSLASKLDQVINLTLVACDTNSYFGKYENSHKWRERYSIVIEILDGEYWEVYSSNEELISCLQNKYSDIETSHI